MYVCVCVVMSCCYFVLYFLLLVLGSFFCTLYSGKHPRAALEPFGETLSFDKIKINVCMFFLMPTVFSDHHQCQADDTEAVIFLENQPGGGKTRRGIDLGNWECMSSRHTQINSFRYMLGSWVLIINILYDGLTTHKFSLVFHSIYLWFVLAAHLEGFLVTWLQSSLHLKGFPLPSDSLSGFY